MATTAKTKVDDGKSFKSSGVYSAPSPNLAAPHQDAPHALPE